MACKQWKDEWVAWLYDELEPRELAECDTHLAACEDCRRTVEQLDASRRMLRECEPPLPSSPRLVVLQPRRPWHSAWTFAAGAACALLAFAIGLFAAPRIGGAFPLEQVGPIESTARTGEASVASISRELERLQELQAGFERRVSRLEESPGSALQTDGGNRLTRAQLEDELRRMERQFNREREQDLEAVMRSMTASEMRTGSFMDETRSAIQVLALRQDPRFHEK
jgi:hypothetical protein